MTDEDYVFFNNNNEDTVSAYDQDDSQDNNLLNKFIGRYHYIRYGTFENIRWKYRGAKWYARQLGYRIRNGHWPNPYTHTENAVYRYGYLEYAWIKCIDELAFMPIEVNKTLSLFTSRESE